MPRDRFCDTDDAACTAHGIGRSLDRLAEAIRRGEAPGEMATDDIRYAYLRLGVLIGRSLGDEAMEMERVRALAALRSAA